VFGCPARGEIDAVALAMLRDLIATAGVDLEIGAPGHLSSELIAHARERGVGLVVVASLPPGGLAHARYLCKRLRAAMADVRIVAGRFTPDEDAGEVRAALTAAGADLVGTRLLEIRDAVVEAARMRPGTRSERVA